MNKSASPNSLTGIYYVSTEIYAIISRALLFSLADEMHLKKQVLQADFLHRPACLNAHIIFVELRCKRLGSYCVFDGILASNALEHLPQQMWLWKAI